jgi:hypothetical protein
MLWTIFVILLVLWALGLVTSYTMGGFIHILLVLAVVVLIINLIRADASPDVRSSGARGPGSPGPYFARAANRCRPTPLRAARRP